jgi:NAD(P)-dependent dehydrogenase (short-subunit alcohol dehydrogenase family)
LDGKTALIVGGGTGIGLATAVALAQAGCRVVIAGRRQEVLARAAARAAATFAGPPAIIHHPVDVGDPHSVETLVSWSIEQLGQIDIFVNSAGINVVRRTLAELSIEDWERLLHTNASGAFYCLRSLLPHMRRRKQGLIVNVSSIAGKRASVLSGIGYSAAKFALTALGMTAGIEEAEHNIRITNLYPGEVDTPILDMRPQPLSDEHRARILQPSDVAAAITMLATLPPRVHIPEMVIKSIGQVYR